MKNAAIVAVFGMFGVLLRYWISLFSGKYFPSAELSIATFMINIIGAFLIGIVYVLGIERGAISPELRVSLTVGLLGGFTTFSAYCMESIALWERGEFLFAAFYVISSPAIGLLACYAGVALMRSLEKI